MKLAYVDTSCLVAIAFAEKGHSALSRRLARFDRLFASNLAEAELRAAFRREELSGPEALLAGIDWVFPDRPLTEEYEEVLAVDYVRGADLFHLGAALYLQRFLGTLAFETVDARQRRVSTKLGF